MALEGRTEGIAPGIMNRGAAMCSGDRSSGKQRSHASVEASKRVELVAARANALGQCVLIDEFAVYPSLVFSTGSWVAPAVIYDTHANGLVVMTDWTIVLNAAMSAIGSVSLRTALLVSLLCTKSAIVLFGSRPWALGLNITL